jgi:DNA (cytosine-5)-methyltransferase 1
LGKPLLLDLFCGAGGAATGYADAGFDVVGVDVERQPRYPFPFIQDDALAFLDWMLAGNSDKSFDAIHASPPCQGYSKLAVLHRNRSYPMLIEPVRDRLTATGLPYVIENVEGAPLINPVVLCGSQFALTCWWPGNGRVGLRRHRLFESNILIPDAGPHDHSLLSVPVYGHGGAPGNRKEFRGGGHSQACRDVMRIHWMNREELSEAIPPAYTAYIGWFLKLAIANERDTAIGNTFEGKIRAA